MKEKILYGKDKLSFVWHLYRYCNRSTNAKVRVEYAQSLSVSERSFSDKMLNHRSFKGQELDLVRRLYKQNLGSEEYDKQWKVFLRLMSDGDRRQFSNFDEPPAALLEQNEELVLAHIYL